MESSRPRIKKRRTVKQAVGEIIQPAETDREAAWKARVKRCGGQEAALDDLQGETLRKLEAETLARRRTGTEGDSEPWEEAREKYGLPEEFSLPVTYVVRVRGNGRKEAQARLAAMLKWLNESRAPELGGGWFINKPPCPYLVDHYLVFPSE